MVVLGLAQKQIIGTMEAYKMTKYVCNAISIQMLMGLSKFRLDAIEISKDFFFKMTRDAISFMGHHDIAELLRLDYNRSDLYLKDGDVLYIAQYVGGRTSETTEIPIEDKPLKFYQIIVEEK